MATWWVPDGAHDIIHVPDFCISDLRDCMMQDLASHHLKHHLLQSQHTADAGAVDETTIDR